MEPDEKDIVFVVGALDKDYKPPVEVADRAFKVECCDCKRLVWIMLANLAKTSICMECCEARFKKLKPEEINIAITDEDAENIKNYIQKHP